MDFDPITIHNPTGEAYRQCLMGRREQMIRELVMNAVEACRHKPEGERDIYIYGATNHQYPVPKLAIWNRGGMSIKTLKQFSDLNVAIDKQNSVHDNFGRGAKIASLTSNQLGMRYRSCCAGRVLEVTLAILADEEQVVRVVPQDGADVVPGTLFIRDVTREYPGNHPFLNLQSDWTEVVLMGNLPEQDTTRVPFHDTSLPESLWLLNALGYRFFDLPEGVRIRLHSSLTRYRNEKYFRPFYTMRETIPYAGRFDSVPFEGGFIHYIQARKDDGPARQRLFGPDYVSKVGRSSGFGGIVWRNEIYDLHVATSRSEVTLSAKPWPPLALRWGLVRAYNQVSILVELNDSQARNDINRVELLGPYGVRIDPDYFTDAVRENMPEWVRELEKSLEPKEDTAAQSIRQYLRELIREFRNQHMGLALGGEKDLPVQPTEDGQGDGEHKGGKPGAKGPRLEEGGEKANGERRLRYLEAPLVKWVNNQWFEDIGLSGQAGHFARPTTSDPGTIYFNEEHEVFASLVKAIKDRLPEAESQLAHEVAQTAAKNVAYVSVGTFVVAGLFLRQLGVEEQEVWKTLGGWPLTTSLATTRFSRHFPDWVAEARSQYQTQRTATEKALLSDEILPAGVS